MGLNCDCCCGFRVYDETPTGGLNAGGTASLTDNFYNPTGGIRCGGSAYPSIPTQVWDTFTAVYHLVGSYSAIPQEVIDSTTSDLDGTGGNGSGYLVYVPTQTIGPFDHAQLFDGNDLIVLPEDSMQDRNSYTVSLWAAPSGLYLDRSFFSRGKADITTAEGWSVQIGHTMGYLPTAHIQVVGDEDWIIYTLTGDTALTAECWYHFAVTFDSGNEATLYVNGVAVDSVSIAETDLAPSSLGSYIGRLNNYQFIEGKIEEVRISPLARDDSWIETEFNNLCDSSFYTVSQEESPVYGG